VKILFRICSDRISGSGGSELAAELEAMGEERGEECPAEDIASWRETTGDVSLRGTRRIAAVRTSIQPLLHSLQ
jgi:hypothetical protein